MPSGETGVYGVLRLRGVDNKLKGTPEFVMGYDFYPSLQQRSGSLYILLDKIAGTSI